MDNKIWMISDTHFGHAKIIEYESRQFDSVYLMDKCMIQRWNSVVSSDDIVYHLGDVAFYYTVQQLTKLLGQLKGRKVLIMGNHDTNHSPKVWRQIGFEQVYRHPIIYDEFFMMSHKPLYVNKSMPYVNIHGHIHSNKYDDNQHVNVSVQQINYFPISFDEIKGRYV